MSAWDGGQAFPLAIAADAGGFLNHGKCGMTLRDYFAAQALTALLSTRESINALTAMAVKHGEPPAVMAALCSYDYADAMLKARELKP